MNSWKTLRGLLPVSMVVLLLAAATFVPAQALRYLGTVTAIQGDTLTVTDTSGAHLVTVPATAQLKRIEPGQTDLSKAIPIDFSSLATGDRVLVTIDPNATGGTPQAARIIAIKQADVAKKQQAETAAWNQGVHGLVKTVDAASGTIVVNTRAGAVTKAVTVNTTKTTVLKRYAPGSVRFDQAQPAPIDSIRAGDQLWARGTKSADGTSIAADGIVSGSFRSIAGTVISTDPAASTITVKDLATKKPATIHVSADAQLKRLDENIATMIAARLKGGTPAFAPGMWNRSAGGNAPTGAPAGGKPPSGASGNSTQTNTSQSSGSTAKGSATPAAGGPPRAWGQGWQGGGAPGGGDLETILERAPTIQLGSLQKGEAVMIVATEDAQGDNAIKMLAGVAPFLQAPEAQDLLSSWSLNQGGGEAAE